MLSNRHREWTNFLKTIFVLKQRSESKVLSILQSDWGSAWWVSLLSPTACNVCSLPSKIMAWIWLTFMQDLRYWTIFVSFYLLMHWKLKACIESQGEETVVFLLLLPSDNWWLTLCLHGFVYSRYFISMKSYKIASCVASFSKYYTFKVLLCCSIYQCIITFIGE